MATSSDDSQNTGSEEAPAAEGSRIGIRARVVSLVVFSALIPALLVGIASYLTARSILLEKVNAQLSGHAAAALQQAELWFEERADDARVFSSAFIVHENLALWHAATSPDDAVARLAQSRIEQYLSQVKDRDPRYLELIVLDSDGHQVARTEASGVVPPPPGLMKLFDRGADSVPHRSGASTVVYGRHVITGEGSSPLGSLVTGASLDGLWRQLGASRRGGPERLRVLDASGRLLFDTTREPPYPDEALESEAATLFQQERSGVARYRDEAGETVLSGYRFVPSSGLALLVEVPTEEAFAAVHRLRSVILFISLVAAILVSVLGFAQVRRLSRPIGALIAGAQAVSRGDLSRQIPVRSGDEIGYLTQVFNRMTTSLRESYAQLEILSTTDDLTGLFNRRQLSDVFQQELSRADRTNDVFSIMMIDIDHFKAFNDRFGHVQGDVYLRQTADFLLTRLRPTDVVVRFGGEEFLIVMPATKKAEAGVIGERIRMGFSEVCQGPRVADSPPLTISVGVASWPADGTSEKDLIRAADAAMYKAKERGRNQVAMI